METGLTSKTGVLSQAEAQVRSGRQSCESRTKQKLERLDIGPLFRPTPLRKHYARQVAKLHIEGISTGFISSLGLDFVTALYEAISESEKSFGFVTSFVTDDDQVVGFVAFSTDVGRLYRSIIMRKGLRFALLLAGKIFSLQRVKKVLETLFYPGRIKKMSLPSAELLSIAIAPQVRRMGLASELIEKGLEHCVRAGIDGVKVTTAANNEAANRLYEKCGFVLTTQISNHGIPSNIYVADLSKAKQACEAGDVYTQNSNMAA